MLSTTNHHHTYASTFNSIVATRNPFALHGLECTQVFYLVGVWPSMTKPFRFSPNYTKATTSKLDCWNFGTLCSKAVVSFTWIEYEFSTSNYWSCRWVNKKSFEFPWYWAWSSCHCAPPSIIVKAWSWHYNSEGGMHSIRLAQCTTQAPLRTPITIEHSTRLLLFCPSYFGASLYHRWKWAEFSWLRVCLPAPCLLYIPDLTMASCPKIEWEEKIIVL